MKQKYALMKSGIRRLGVWNIYNDAVPVTCLQQVSLLSLFISKVYIASSY